MSWWLGESLQACRNVDIKVPPAAATAAHTISLYTCTSGRVKGVVPDSSLFYCPITSPQIGQMALYLGIRQDEDAYIREVRG